MDYTESHKNRFGVEPIVEVLNEHGVTIALSTYYEHAARGFGPTEAELEDAYAANEVHRQWTANRRLYGQHKLWKTTVRAGGVTGVQRGRDQVARLMRIAAIRAVVVSRSRTKSGLARASCSWRKRAGSILGPAVIGVFFFESVVRDHSKDPPGGRAHVGGMRSLRSVVHHSAELHWRRAAPSPGGNQK
jgi:hypothetical protein